MFCAAVMARGAGLCACGYVHVLRLLWHVQVRQSDLDKETPYQSRILGQTTNQNSFVL